MYNSFSMATHLTRQVHFACGEALNDGSIIAFHFTKFKPKTLLKRTQINQPDSHSSPNAVLSRIGLSSRKQQHSSCGWREMENKNETPPDSPITDTDSDDDLGAGLEVPIDEPKTLTAAEFAAFKEAAVKIIMTRTPEEAAKIFMGEVDSIVVAASEAAKPAEPEVAKPPGD